MNSRYPIIILVALFWGHPVLALSEKDSAKEGVVTMEDRARLRLYPGGVDEQDIQVQEQLPAPRQKVTKKEVEKSVYEELLTKGKEDSSTSEETSAQE